MFRTARLRLCQLPSWAATVSLVAVAIMVADIRVFPALALPPISGSSMVLQTYDGSSIPTNGGGDQYPYWSDGNGGEGGYFTGSLDSSDSVSGKSFKANLVARSGTGNALYAQFNPYDGQGRLFARTYSANPSAWKFNTYNRMTIWIKLPAESRPIETDGTTNANIGAYAKRVANYNPNSDEDGGGHFYYNQNWPKTGTWTQLILNAYVDHWRGNNGNTEEGSALHITGESNYNLFDALTRFYLQVNNPAPSLPTSYGIDEVRFYQEVNAEPEQQVRDIAATYVPSSNRVIVTWFRNKNENTVNHEVRYSFSDIHQGGWNSATAAPSGVRTPPGDQGYNGMYYDSTALPLSGRSMVYIGIKPLSNNPQGLFAQVAIPLTAGGAAPPPPASAPVPPSNLRIIP
jgi:hypothetical protein